MLKRTLALLLSISLLFLVSCKKETKKVKKKTSEPSSSEVPVNTNIINPLTGVQDLNPSLKDRRPVAVMINNTSIAQPVQSGVGKADIVYETEVEGGVTRLLAVFKNFEGVGQLGTIRSARYPYIDLASGHDAIYLHHGQDPIYAAPHLNDVDHLTVGENNGGKRIRNGLATEHTLYGFTDKLWQTLQNSKIRTTSQNNNPWQNFAEEEEAVSFAGNVANSVLVPFQYSATFNYDAATGKYIRSTRSGVRLDYVTKENMSFKNVFVLYTSITNYPDGKHRRVALDSGDGYYAVNGTYTQIRWTKGSQKNGFSFTDVNGAPLKVNRGNSWVFIVNRSTTVPQFS